MDIVRSPLFAFLENSFLREIKITGYLDQKLLIVTKSDEVYGLGSLPDFTDTMSISEPKPIPELCKKNVERFVFGNNFVFTLMENNEVFAWGENENGQLGIGHRNPTYEPTKITSFEGKEIIDISCGLVHVMALSKDQQAYEWGYDGKRIFQEPRDIGTGIIGIASSENAAFYLSSNGEVRGIGYLNKRLSDGYYSMGNGYLKERFSNWTKIANLVNIKKIVCGKSHTMALNNDGILFVWGDNQKKQLGQYFPTEQVTPTIMPCFCFTEKIIDIAANSLSDISVAKTESSKIYVWGRCSGGIIWQPYLTKFKTFEEVFTHFSYPSMTYKGVIFQNVKQCKLLETGTFESFFDMQEDSDLTITIQEKPIYVHKVILKARSKYFLAMFTNQWKENNKKTLKIDGYSYDSYKSFLSYLYTGEINITSENIFELVAIADKYTDDALLDLIEKKLDNNNCSIPNEIVRILKDIMKLSSPHFEQLFEGIKKRAISSTSQYI